MNYQVLARKWRPRNFADTVGQEHVLRGLINALNNQRLHHAYLFTGTRGVGKTTIARIFAKCLNCDQGISAEPCSQCEACRAIDAGAFVDLMEIDAASRTKVEDTRELLENVQYAPESGRYKVYLIDEVHMLSTHSFNALLKTLEEPPAHVKFLLATTDPQKLPITILSRCLQFHLKVMPAQLIQQHIAWVLKEEDITFEDQALNLISHNAEGSMRDALSLLDLCIAYANGPICCENVQQMLGIVPKSWVVDALKAISQGDAAQLMTQSAQLAEQSPDYRQVLEVFLNLLHRVAVVQLLPKSAESWPEDEQSLLDISAHLSPELTQLLYQIALIGRQDLAMAPQAQIGFEMVLLRMLAFRPAGLEPEICQKAPPSKEELRNNEPPTKSDPSMQWDWHKVVPQLGLKGIELNLVRNSILKQVETDTIHLKLQHKLAGLLQEKQKQKIQAALSHYAGRCLELTIELEDEPAKKPSNDRAPDDVKKITPNFINEQLLKKKHQAAIKSIENDQSLQALIKRFDGKIIESSVKPLDI